MKVVCYWLAMFIFGAGALWLNLVSFLVVLLGSRRRLRSSVYRLTSALMRFFLFLSRSWHLGDLELPVVKETPPGKPGTLFIANHTGLLDALFLMAAVPDAVFLYKAAIRKNPFFSHTPLATGFIENHGTLGNLNQLAKELREGRNVLIFPEGTRTDVPPINRFRAGFAYAAIRANVPIQTILVDNPSRLLGKGFRLDRPPKLPIRYHFRLGERFEVQYGESRQELTCRIEAYYRDALSKTTHANIGID